MYPPFSDCNCHNGTASSSLGNGIYVVAGGRATRIGEASPGLLAAVLMGAQGSNGGDVMFGELGVDECKKKFQAIYKKYIDDNGLKCNLENCLTAYSKVNTNADYQAVATACAGVITGATAVAGCC